MVAKAGKSIAKEVERFANANIGESLTIEMVEARLAQALSDALPAITSDERNMQTVLNSAWNSLSQKISNIYLFLKKQYNFEKDLEHFRNTIYELCNEKILENESLNQRECKKFTSFILNHFFEEKLINYHALIVETNYTDAFLEKVAEHSGYQIVLPQNIKAEMDKHPKLIIFAAILTALDKQSDSDVIIFPSSTVTFIQ